VALAGSGLSSLTAARDLIRKGYAVTLFEAGTLPCPALRQMNPAMLPPGVSDGEIATLTRLGVVFGVLLMATAMLFAPHDPTHPASLPIPFDYRQFTVPIAKNRFVTKGLSL
jgi:ribulose 1,5-bisphosphate synthetase/thiazole synthase